MVLLHTHFPSVLTRSSLDTEMAEDSYFLPNQKKRKVDPHASPGPNPPMIQFLASTTVDPLHLSLNLRILAFAKACRTVPLPYPPPSAISSLTGSPSLSDVDADIDDGDEPAPIFSKYGRPSRPISPTALAVPTDAKMTTSRNEQGEIDNRNTTAGSQSDLEKHPQQYNHQQRSTLPPSTIPPELIDHIINHLHDDKQSLTQCSRTSRVFSHAMSYHLFGTVRILDRSQRWPAFATRRSLTTCVRSLGLAGQWRAPVSSSLPSEFHPGTIG